MSQIVLNDNLKYLITGLTLEQRGELFTSILEKISPSKNPEIAGVYQYIMSQQKEIEAKKQHMREIGSKGGKAKNKIATIANTEPSDGITSQTITKTKRKEAKENNIYNKKIKTFINDMIYTSSDVENNTPLIEKTFIPPTIIELKSFIKKEKLNISAETFIDFYQARNWKMGNIKISDWQAVARMWHRRQKENPYQKQTGTNKITSSDEQYWQELKERVNSSSPPDEENQNTPFKRFIKRVEAETNIFKETENDTQN